MVKPSQDKLGRRKRIVPTPTGKRISLQDADYLWFEKLYEHGPLPSSFLLEYSAQLRKSRKRATERLTDLFNETETRHGGHYLERPIQQYRTIDSRYNQLVYELAPAGQKALSLEYPDQPGDSKPSGPWLHRFMVSCVTASIELTTLERSDVSFISQQQILSRAKTNLRYPIKIVEQGKRQTVASTLIPDAVFGLEYHTSAGSRYRFFALECDRSTEPLRSSSFNRKSWLRNLFQYREYVGKGMYKSHLGLTAPLLVLNVTTEEKRVEKMITVTEKEVGDTGIPYLLFKHVEDFGPDFRPPYPMKELIHSPWRRAGRKDFRIDTP